MKRTLLALASCTVLCGAASAQSSVTIFGVVDLNARWLDNNGVTQYSMSQDGLAPSRLGFRGVEDLGGGLKAGFWLEMPLNPDIGNAGVRLAFTRRSTVSLSNAWGEVRLGRDETATYYNSGHFDPFGDTGIGAAGNERSGNSPDNVEGQKAEQLAIGAVYWLSKRTALYGPYSTLDNKGGASFIVGSFNNLTDGGAAVNGDSQGAEFGVMHSF
jgi:predicted porin